MPDFDYHGYQVSLRSYKVGERQWTPEALVQKTTGTDVQIAPVRGASGRVYSDEREANDEAGRLAIAWIHAQ